MHKKIQVLSADNFQFSRRFDRARIHPLLVRVQTLAGLLAELPVLPGLLAELDADLQLRSICASAALSGNGLTQAQAARILAAPESEPPPLAPAALEIHNLGRACRPVARTRREFGVLRVSEEQLQKIHAAVTSGLHYPLTEPGRYRLRSLEVGDASQGGAYVPPRQAREVRSLMEQLTAWINSDPLLHEPPLLRAALFAFHYAAIHPFDTGNHRTGRVFQAMILAAAGQRWLPWLPALAEQRAPLEAFAAFLESLADMDLTAYLEQALGGLVAQLLEIKPRLLVPLARLTQEHRLQELLDQRQLSPRQLDLLHLLQESGQALSLRQILGQRPFSLLYSAKTMHTARRDLLRLAELGLVTRQGRTFQSGLAPGPAAGLAAGLAGS